jgi:tetratricopeptide (TPR) repeat protein
MTHSVRTLERGLGANEAQLAAFFQIIGEAHVPPEQQPTRLIEIAAQWRELRPQVAIEQGDAPEVAQLKDGARAALDAGLPQEADDVLAQVEAAQDTVLNWQQREAERQQMERAATAAQRGGVALTCLRYLEAAQHFAAATERVAPGRDDQELACLDQKALALHRLGMEFGDKTALVDATARCRALLDRRDRERVPLDWAMTQNNLGTALQMLGERESGTARLEEAVAAYRAALEVFRGAGADFHIAVTEGNLARAEAVLAKRRASGLAE